MACIIWGNQKFKNRSILESVINAKQDQLLALYNKYQKDPDKLIFKNASEANKKRNELLHKFNPTLYDNSGRKLEQLMVDGTDKIFDAEVPVRLIRSKDSNGKLIYKIDIMEPNLPTFLVNKEEKVKQIKRMVMDFKSQVHDDVDLTVAKSIVGEDLDFDRGIKSKQLEIETRQLKQSLELSLESLNKINNELKNKLSNADLDPSQRKDLALQRTFVEDNIRDVLRVTKKVKDRMVLSSLIEEAHEDLNLFEAKRRSRLDKIFNVLQSVQTYDGYDHVMIEQAELLINRWQSIFSFSTNDNLTINKELLNNVSKIASSKRVGLDDKGIVTDVVFSQLNEITTIEELIVKLSSQIESTGTAEVGHYLNYELFKEIIDKANNKIEVYKNELNKVKLKYFVNKIFLDPDNREALVNYAAQMRPRFPDLGSGELPGNWWLSTAEYKELFDKIDEYGGGDLSENDLLRMLGNLMEHNWLDKFGKQFTDHTRSQSALGAFALKLYIQGNINYATKTKKNFENIIEHQRKIEKYIIDNDLGNREKSLYDIFLRRDENNPDLYKDGLVRPYTDSYDLIYSGALNNYIKTMSKLDEVKNKRNHSSIAFREFYGKLLEHSHLIDFRKLPEIEEYAATNGLFDLVYNDPAIGINYIHQSSEEYRQEMIDAIGNEFMYESIVENIKIMLNNYVDYRNSLESKSIAEVDEEGNIIYESEISEEEFKRQIYLNNPLLLMAELYDGAKNPEFYAALSESKKHFHSNYIAMVPRDTKAIVSKGNEDTFAITETNEELNYKVQNFQDIFNDETLREYYLFATDLIENLSLYMPIDNSQRYFMTSLPVVNPQTKYRADKSMLQSFYDDASSYVHGVHEEVLNRLTKTYAGTRVYDPFTSQDQDSDKYTGLIFKANIYGYRTERDVKNKYKDIVELEAKSKGLEKNTDLWRNYVNRRYLEIINDLKSFDLTEILQHYSRVALNFYYRNQVAPTLGYMKDFTKKRIDLTKLSKGEIEATMYQSTMEYERYMDWLLRRVMNAGEARQHEDIKEKFNQSNLKKRLDFYFSGEGKDSSWKIFNWARKLWYKSALFNNVFTKYNTEDRKQIRMVLDVIKKHKQEEYYEAALDIFKNIFKEITAEGRAELYFYGVNLKFLGWNWKSAIRNLNEGIAANWFESILGQKFNPVDHAKSLRLMLDSSKAFYSRPFYKSKNKEKRYTDTAKKIRYMIEFYNTLQDSTEDSNSFIMQSEASQKMNFLNPFSFTASAEYFIQGQLLLMILMNKEVVGKNGELSNLWDILDWDSKNNTIGIKEEFNTEKNRGMVFGVDSKNIFESVSKDVVDLKYLIDETTTTIHGNYSNLRSMLIKNVSRSGGVFGVGSIVMRTYLPEKINYLYGGYRIDLGTKSARSGILRDSGPLNTLVLGTVESLMQLTAFEGPISKVLTGVKTLVNIFSNAVAPAVLGRFAKRKYGTEDEYYQRNKYTVVEAGKELGRMVTGTVALVGDLTDALAKQRYNNRKVDKNLSPQSNANLKQMYARIWFSLINIGINYLIWKWIMRMMHRLLYNDRDTTKVSSAAEPMYNFGTRLHQNLIQDASSFRVKEITQFMNDPLNSGLAGLDHINQLVMDMDANIQQGMTEAEALTRVLGMALLPKVAGDYIDGETFGEKFFGSYADAPYTQESLLHFYKNTGSVGVGTGVVPGGISPDQSFSPDKSKNKPNKPSKEDGRSLFDFILGND